MHGLNPPQQDAVSHFGSPLLVLAGAGSGKTRVITEKIVALIRQQQIPSNRIAAITFTNKAAREMEHRVKGLLQPGEGKGLHISTFHNLGLNIIRRELTTLGYKSGFTIFDGQDCGVLLKELSRKDNVENAEDARWDISNWKNGFIQPEQALMQAENAKTQYHARLYERYQRQLHAYNAMDFDDLITLPVQLFQNHPDILEKWQNRLHYLLIDEYQDTNACQYNLVKQLAGAQGRFTAVGDDDQSIYAWRGAQPENLGLLKKDFPSLRLIKLEQNYRSTSRILQAANGLIALNPHEFEKKLWSALGEGVNPLVLRCNNADHEAERVVSEILKLKFKQQSEYGEFAILYRGNHQSRLFENKLREHHIPYKISGGTSFFERAEIKDIVAYLRLVVNPDDDAAFLRIINTPRRQIGASTLEKLGAYSGQRGVSMLSASQEMGLAEHLGEQSLLRLRRFTDWIWELSRRVESESAVSLAREIVREINYDAWLRDLSSDINVAERRMQNVEELIAWVSRLAGEKDNQKPLSDVISRMMLMDILERNKEDEATDMVQLMTLHAAKGLEFPHVFMVGVEEEFLPHKNSIESDTLEEERRLTYVGITRAQRTLFLTYAAKRKKYGDIVECEPSRFLKEIPKAFLDWETQEDTMSAEERHQQGRAHLSQLKDLLG